MDETCATGEQFLKLLTGQVSYQLTKDNYERLTIVAPQAT